ncbi:MAG: hypothetical protein Q9227_004762 [Pyrenula ochraceoflavens]
MPRYAAKRRRTRRNRCHTGVHSSEPKIILPSSKFQYSSKACIQAVSKDRPSESLQLSSRTMFFHLQEVTSASDFSEIIKLEWRSYEDPYSPLLRLFFPIFGTDSEARAESLQESTDRQIKWHESDPSSHWIKVTDSSSGNIVGAANWNFFDENPYSTESDEECTWFKEGEDRKMANFLMGQFLTPRTTYMAKPHVCE